MMSRRVFYVTIFLVITLLVTLVIIIEDTEGKGFTPEIVPRDTLPAFFNQTPKEGLDSALRYYNIEHREIVYAQAVLETGYFKSPLCVNHNNLFGLYDSKNHRYYTFSHWTESVKAYKDWVQYKYKPHNDYYQFLSDIKYATAPNYIKVLQELVKQIQDDKRRHIKRDTIP